MKSPSLVILGLSVTSSWGNGHATTYRALLKGLRRSGYELLFLERDVPWYASNRDCTVIDGCRVELYQSVADLRQRFETEIRDADSVIVGSYVPDGAEVLRWVLDVARGNRLFYDIDTPVTLSELRRGKPTYIAPESIPELDAYLSFSSGPVLQLIERQFGARRALALCCSVDPELYRPLESVPKYALSYLGTYSEDRQPGLEALLLEPARRLPELRFIVGGSGYPALAWPPNVQHIEHVPPSEHAAFFARSRFTINVTRSDMKRLGYSPSVRLFEAAACATAIISDEWQGLESFFEPGREILIANDTERVLRYLEQTSEARRIALGKNARARVLREHTAMRRAQLLDSYLRGLNAPNVPVEHSSTKSAPARPSVAASEP